MSTTSPSVVYAGRLIDGRFTLVRPLGETESSSVCLAEYGDESRQKATIKLIQASAVDAEVCIAHWEHAKSLSHPHIVRLLHHGRTEIDGKDFLYVATEYADEILSEILPERALTPDETREMLSPVLDALSFLHAQNLVHGQLKSSNILVVEDHLKLSVDGIAAAGETVRRAPSPYSAPETGTAAMSPAVDLWSLGVVLVQALTQQLPAWNRNQGGEPQVPASIPEPFSGIARECLRVDPARRLTLNDVKARLDPASTVPAAPVQAETSAQPAEPAEQKKSAPASAPVAEPPNKPDKPAGENAEKPSVNRNVQAVIGTLIVIGVALFVMRANSRHTAPATLPQAATSAPPAAQHPKPTPVVRKPSAPIVKGEVSTRSLPEIPAKVSGAIHGHIKVAIRVQVDSQGNVTQASIDSAGPSHYFADQALHAAQKWKFTPAWIGGRIVPSTWLLHFEFGQSGTEANAQEESP